MSGTRAAEVKTALITRLKDQPDLAGVGVDYSLDETFNECVYLGRTVIDQAPRARSAQSRMVRATRDEVLDITVIIRVIGIGQKPQETETRANKLGEAVEAVIFSDTPLVSGLSVEGAITGALDSSPLPDGSLSVLSYVFRMGSRF